VPQPTTAQNTPPPPAGRDKTGSGRSASTADIGLRVLDHAYKQMKVDREWSANIERGFVWWGHRLAQWVWAEPCFDDDGIIIARLHARTDVLTGFAPTPEQLRALIPFLRMASLSGLVRDAEDEGRLQLACSMYVHDQTFDWVKRAFSLAVAMQAAEAELLADALAGALGARVAASAHPHSGARPEPDDMLNVLQAVVIPEGAGPSQFPGRHFLTALETMEQGGFLASGEEDALTMEFPFGDRTSLCQLTTKDRHPWLGAGLLRRLSLPLGPDEEAARVEQALTLNEWELGELTRTHFLGSWCPDTHGLTHVTFFPNSWSGPCPGYAVMAALNSLQRARWAARLFNVAWDPEATLRRKVEQLESLTDLPRTRPEQPAEREDGER
jgi:hypothetical protein